MSQLFSPQAVAAAYTHIRFFPNTSEGGEDLRNSERLIEILGAGYSDDPNERVLYYKDRTLNEGYNNYVRGEIEKLSPGIDTFEAWAKKIEEKGLATRLSYNEIYAVIRSEATESVFPIEVEEFSGKDILAAYTQNPFLIDDDNEAQVALLTEYLGADYSRDPQKRNPLDPKYLDHIRRKLEAMSPYIPMYMDEAEQFEVSGRAINKPISEIYKEERALAMVRIAPLHIANVHEKIEALSRPRFLIRTLKNVLKI